MSYHLSSPQMVLLWRDPEGETVSTIPSNGHAKQKSCKKESLRIVSLEKTISQKDSLIAQLRDEISLLKGVGLTKILCA